LTDAEEHATTDEARAFAKSFLGFLSWVHDDPLDGQRNPVVALVRDHLGDAVDRSILGNELAAFEQVNLQVAVNVWIAAEGRTVVVHGISMPPRYEQPTMQQLVHGEGLGPVRLSAPDLVDLPSGPDQTIACLRSAVLLVEDVRGRYVVMIRGPERHQEPVLTVEVAGLPTAIAQEVLRELADLRHKLNVYRGQLLELAFGQNGLSITFPVLAATSREDVVLPEQTLRRVERHTLDIVTHRDALRLAGQHLKRGLLLYGPPGTGKTHTMRYVVQQLRGATVILLSGQSLHAVATITQMARDLQPAVVVLEDVDLVAEDRGFGPGANPVLFSLLDAMDGAAADADLLFLLTTNRADLLEPALAARPGRVDVAVEIPLPDADARRRLLAVYTRGVPLALAEADVDDVVTRTDGVTASFVKELVRRAVLEALTAGRPVGEPITAEVMFRALDDLLDSGQAVTRALLGVGTAGTAGTSGGRAAGGHTATGWLASGAARPGLAYGSSFHISTDE
jgi:cell division protease FtsH